MVKKTEQKGGSYASDKVNASSVEAGQAALDDIFNLTTMPEPTMKGGAKKSKKKRTNSKRKTKKNTKKTKRRKMSRGYKKTMRGGGVSNLMGCGPVNNASTFKNPGCDRDTIMNPPNLGLAGSGMTSVDGLAGL
jgi:hypothetical protein